MNPNPFASLNHFTVPVTIETLLSMFRQRLAASSPRLRRSVSVTNCPSICIPDAPQHLYRCSGRLCIRRRVQRRSPGIPGLEAVSKGLGKPGFWVICMASQLSERASGVLLHPTSLPGAHGSGDLGPEAHAFARWLGEAEQGWWQMLPVGPVGYGNSPYSAHSAFAGNPLLISLDSLVQEGLLERASPAGAPAFPKGRVDHAASRAWRNRHLRAAFAAFSKRAADRGPFEDFCAQNAAWLEDFALFMAIKHTRGDRPWTDWEPDLRAREPAALARARQALADEVHQHRFEQFLFARQWQSLRDRCRTLGVGLIGDIPIFVAPDSSDVWTHPDLFCLDRKGHPTVVAGVPPDYFSRTGQRWGNPLYDWEKIERTGFRWWLQRFAHAFARFDAVRLDHFIGFTRYWEVPA